MARAERPLDIGDTPLLRFAADLRKLREEAGRPAYRELGRRANYSIGALSDAAGGRKLPSLAVTLAYVSACGGDTEAWTQRWHQVTVEVNTTPGTGSAAPDEGPAPYTGLAVFQSQDADRFFGRERLMSDLCNQVTDHRLVVVTGPSGSGKSSLLRAGLLPDVYARGWLTVVMTPGMRPLDESAAHFATLIGGSINDVLAALRENSGHLHLIGLQALADRAARCELLVLVDQFEEVFTLCRDPEERQQFMHILHAAAHAPNSRIRIVLGVRADFYAHCAYYPELAEALRDAQVLVGPMTTDELRSAITQPAIQSGCRVETALVSRVIADATGQPGVLPLVSHAMLETWRRRQGNILTLVGYDAAGGITEAITRTAEAIFAGLSAGQQRWARQLFLRLTALGNGTEDTKRRLDRTELDLDDPAASTVLEQLTRSRLVTVDHDSVQITHEALIRHWPRLRHWLDEDRESLYLHRQLTDAAVVWESVDRDPGALYRGTRLDLARGLTGSNHTTLTSRERTFLDASLRAESTERAVAARHARLRRQLIAVLSVLLILTTTTTILAVRAERQISDQRDVALAQKVAGDAVALRTINSNLAIQLGVAAYQLAQTPQVRDNLLSTLAVPVVGHTQVVSGVAFSPDGRTLATGSLDRTARLWNVTDTNHPTGLATLTGHTGVVSTLAFSPDGQLLATAGRDSTVRLWNVSDVQHPTLSAVLTGHTDTIYSVAFSPDGRTLATGSYDQTARLWNITDSGNATASAVLTGHILSVKPVAFSPDGRTLATGGDDRTVRLWDITDTHSPTQTTILKGHTDFVSSLAFSPDGRVLVTGGDDRTVRLWDITDTHRSTQLTTLARHTDVIASIKFSPSGKAMITSSYDQTARLWDTTDTHHPTELATLVGNAAGVNAADFSPDGRTLATGGDDHMALLLDTDIASAETQACAKVFPEITRAEWDHHLPGVSYQPPCRR